MQKSSERQYNYLSILSTYYLSAHGGHTLLDYLSSGEIPQYQGSSHVNMLLLCLSTLNNNLHQESHPKKINMLLLLICVILETSTK